ncbi:ABC transporter ATP-binding protein [Synechococcus sp. PCC 7336]|uniref:ABC transporter ATP-binding protein n=1 Tax=Synechococcus sp. PCC 7336 TaxID=195250 RepID=UPI0003478BC7|nr:ABC transporter ATP-binding protein [Synechococcus sp. PCC 7336]
MSEPIIRVEQLAKRYLIARNRQQKSRTLAETIFDRARALPQQLEHIFQRKEEHSNREEFWALDDVNFTVSPGDRLGIIGRNGAGKSTLLKILSRITEPTKGRITLRGRVASLLEVGTGFHPELTGRENIYLNGSILGMDRGDIRRKFDEIVAFAEVERFLNTPVKRYSSGMYVRLAFAVAAHLEPEVLIVDEVLAVGDGQFQQKCLGRMEQVGQEGRTVIFVSHDMSAVNRLCQRAILLEGGRVNFHGEVRETIQRYQTAGRENVSEWVALDDASPRDIMLQKVRVLDDRGQQAGVVDFDRPAQVEIAYTVRADPSPWVLMVRVSDSSGHILFTSWDTDSLASKGSQVGRDYCIRCTLPPQFLRPGSYSLTIGAFQMSNPQQIRQAIHYMEDLLQFQVSPNGYNFNPGRKGMVLPVLEWVPQSVAALSEW